MLIAGAGLSAVCGLPTTHGLTADFLTLPTTEATDQRLQSAISKQLRRYWGTVFGYDSGEPPSFEDHFTLLDIAANSGHQLGTSYSPKQLRAIRRLSIHRVFDILELRFKTNATLSQFLGSVASCSSNAIITTNWDLAIEKHLDLDQFNYSIPATNPSGVPSASTGIPIFKLHGSANWAYCDCCGRLVVYDRPDGKGALHRHIFIDKEDFRALGESAPKTLVSRQPTQCWACGVRLSSRVATFSYAKTLNFIHFLTIWHNAFKALREARKWIFVGYSFPEADFQLRHMLKAAELGRTSPLEIVAVAGADDGTIQRYERFFGRRLVDKSTSGFEHWVSTQQNEQKS